jgi:hypothetical protein
MALTDEQRTRLLEIQEQGLKYVAHLSDLVAGGASAPSSPHRPPRPRPSVDFPIARSMRGPTAHLERERGS